MKRFTSIIALTLTLIIPLGAASPRKSLLDNDPNVIYLKEHIDHVIHLLVVKPATAYATKNGKRRVGSFPADTKVELIAMTEKAYRVKGRASHAGITAWVNPNLLASKDKNFIANLKKLYQRQMIVKELIAKHDVAIGMTLGEVSQSLGKPTTSEVRQTRNGEGGKWDYVTTEEQKHYRTLSDPQSGQIYRQLSHVTIEEKSRTTLEFENGVITTVTRKKNNGPGKIRIIPAPIVFHW